MEKIIRIGTRDSRLALWQAQKVQSLLHFHGYKTEIIKVKTEGDLDLVTPLYAMGVQGVFTKTLDAYLLSNKVDIVVHSMKDVPIQLAKGIAQAAVLKRANPHDLLVFKDENFAERFFSIDKNVQKNLQGIVATGSVRRKAALKHRFPQLQVDNLRGNVQTRMQKLDANNWDGAIFAAAGLERINERPLFAIEIDWMLPAPAQGAIMVACIEEDEFIKNACKLLNDDETALCVKVERDFLQVLMGGCSTPISAWAQIKNNTLFFKGNIFSPDGKEKLEIQERISLEEAQNIGENCGIKLLKKGADSIIEKLKNIQ